MTARTVSAPDLAQLGLGEALDEALAAHDLSTTSAAAIAVFTPDGVCDWRALGEPRRDGAPTQRGTVFRIASMTKSFLAATALALRDEGRLDLDGDLALIVPGIRFEWAGESVPVTIRQLLSNCSGMPEDNAWGDRQIGAERSWIAELGAAGFRLTAEPGERYQYSNIGMSFVGRAIEAVTGRSFEAEATTRFLDPLGLADTRFSAEDYPADADLAAGYRTFDGGESFHLEPFVGTGALACIASLFSSLDDVAAWATFLRSAFTPAPVSPELLAPASRRELQRLLTPSPTGPDRE
ncbi:serine hydrolase domain-containing protein, partial [Leucobacter sp. M11]|uniref:serine hydrolase domain-containing protein n=1 Tax=Leucobacter sp. M11 TaxID=2993565 RepID=UPI002D7EFC3F